MGRKNPITYREELLQIIAEQTPEEYKPIARTFSQTANIIGLSPITINNIFIHASEGADEKNPYNIKTLYNLEFSGIDYDVKGTSITGKDYNKLSVHFKNKLGKETYLGWDTAVKLIQAMKVVIPEKIPDILLGKKVNPKRYEDEESREDKYAKTLEEIISAPEKINLVQSINERRKVRSLIGLNEAIKEASRGLYNNYMSFITSKEFFSKTAMEYKELLLEKGGITKRLQNQDYLPEDIENSLILVTKYKKNLTPEIYAKNMHKLKAWDELTTLLDAKGHLARYISDLKELAKEGDITGKAANVIKTTQILHEEKPVITMPEILPFLMLYDVSGKRISKGRKEIEKNAEYKEDFNLAQEYFKNIFIKDNSWKGGRDETIPKKISEELEDVVKKQGDAHLKEAQKWIRSIYSSETQSIDDAIKTKSFEETRREISSLIILNRRKKMKEKLGFTIIDDAQKTKEEFKENYNIELNEFLNRMDDQYRFSHHKEGDWEREETTINKEGGSGLWTEKRFETFKDLIPHLRDDFVPYDDSLKKVVSEYYSMKYKSMITSHHIGDIQLSEGKKYIRKEVLEVIKIVNEKNHIVNKKYEEIETRTNNSIKKYGEYIEQKPEKFENSRLNDYFKIEIQGTRFEEREDFKKTFQGFSWNKQNNAWKKYYPINKAEIGKILEDVNIYNENHRGKIKINIK
jgi:hypothetical protein